jgi:putative PIG3 family NAD(P)H quinone oxidoreductase
LPAERPATELVIKTAARADVESTFESGSVTMTIPATMRHIAVEHPGGPEVMRVADGPVPTPGADDVLIDVAYAGVNRPDCAQRAGTYPPPPDASPVLGLEVSGRIAAVGSRVTRWAVGDDVCALTPGGGYAEYCVTPAAWCLPIPRGWSLLQAAGLPENYYTVWNNVFDRGGLKSGEWFLVHGGTSGIGLTAIQLAKAFGATVMTTAGSDEKTAFCTRIGADHAINYRTHDFADEVKRITGKRGVDVILDMVGGDYVERNLKCLAVEGRLVQIAFLAGSRVDCDWRFIMLKRLTVTGSTLRASPSARKAALARELLDNVWPLLEQQKIQSVIHRTFDLASAAQAHALMESSAHIGKIMLAVKPR